MTTNFECKRSTNSTSYREINQKASPLSDIPQQDVKNAKTSPEIVFHLM
jgi:hypothetical protein